MAKLTLSTIGSRYGSVEALNANFDAIEQAFQDVVYRDGSAPNYIEADIDMNGYTLLNLSALQVGGVNISGLNSAVVWRGTWSGATAYAVSDAVYYGGSSYICVSAHTNSVPPSAAWDVLAAQGATGAGTGDVLGPASATLDTVATYASGTGKALKASGVAISSLALAGPLGGSGITGAAASGANADITSLTALAAGGLPNNSVLTTDIADGAITPAKLSQPLTAGTAVATTSGTAIDFTGIPSWVKRITVMLNGVSTTGTSNIIIQLGTAGSFETTGYDGGSWQANTTITAYSTGFMLGNSNSAASNVKETLVINLFDSATNTFVAFGTGAVNSAGGGNAHIQGGSKSLSGALTRVRLTTVGGADTFDAGSVNILYE